MAIIKTKRKGAYRTKILDVTWRPDLAYVIGLIATDGNISPDLRHISFTSKDEEMVLMYKEILKLSNVIGRKGRGGSKEKNYYVIQFGSMQFCDFLMSIGITNAKSKTIKSVKVPNAYFWDFLRGCLDGDGNISQFLHPESKHVQLRIRFTSASRAFLEWKLESIRKFARITGGWITREPYKSVYTLNFGKSDSTVLIKKMYYSENMPCLKRKRVLAQKYLGE